MRKVDWNFFIEQFSPRIIILLVFILSAMPCRILCLIWQVISRFQNTVCYFGSLMCLNTHSKSHGRRCADEKKWGFETIPETKLCVIPRWLCEMFVRKDFSFFKKKNKRLLYKWSCPLRSGDVDGSYVVWLTRTVICWLFPAASEHGQVYALQLTSQKRRAVQINWLVIFKLTLVMRVMRVRVKLYFAFTV